MTRKHIALLGLSVLIVWWGFGLLSRLPYSVQNYVDQAGVPSAENMVALLTSGDVEERRHGLEAYNYRFRQDVDIRQALAQMALQETQPRLRAQAMKELVGSVDPMLVRADDRSPPLPLETIQRITALLGDEQLPSELFEPLLYFAGHTARWQQRPSDAITDIAVLLEVSTQPRSRRPILIALKDYAQYYALPDTMLNALLQIYTSEPDGYYLNREVAVLYQYSAQHRALPPKVHAAAVTALTEHVDYQMRLNALLTLAAEASHHGEAPPALYAALQDPDPRLRDKASYFIAQIKEGRGDPLARLLAAAHDTNEPGAVRASALHKAILGYSDAQRQMEAILALRSDSDTVVRAKAVYCLPYLLRHPDYRDRTDKLLPYIDQALQDGDAEVRIQALDALLRLKLGEQDLLPRLEQGLQDQDTKVATVASDKLRAAGLDSDTAVALLQQYTHSDDPRLQQSATSTLHIIHVRTRNTWQALVDSVRDTRRHGVRLFWFLSILGIAIAAGFAIDYVFRIIVYIGEWRIRSFAAGGVLLVWIVLSYGMVALFVWTAFGFGHNAMVPPQQQLMLDASIGVALLVYAALGWGMHKLVRR